MEGRALIADGLGRVQSIIRRTLRGLTMEQVLWRPEENANSIAWLAWHLTRVQDHHLSDLMGKPHAWVAEGWHQPFGLPADPGNTGGGHTAEQVGALRPDSVDTLQAFHDAVHGHTLRYLEAVTPATLDQVIHEPQWDPMPTIGVRLVSVQSDNTQHAGQMAYLRGLLEHRRWLGA